MGDTPYFDLYSILCLAWATGIFKNSGIAYIEQKLHTETL